MKAKPTALSVRFIGLSVALLLCAAVGVFCTRQQGQNTIAQAVASQATPPQPSPLQLSPSVSFSAMPLLVQWKSALKAGQVLVAPRSELLIAQFPRFHWQGANAVSVQAKQYENQRITLVQIYNYRDIDTSEQNLFLAKGGRVWQRTLNGSKDGWLDLAETPKIAAAFRKLPPRIASYDYDREQPADLVAVTIKNDRVQMADAVSPRSVRAHPQVFEVYHEKKRVAYLFDLATAHRLARASDETDDYYCVGHQLVSAGIENLNGGDEDVRLRLYWLTRPHDASLKAKWVRYYRSIPANYFEKLLPTSLHNLQPVWVADGLPRGKVGPDGSLIFPFFCQAQVQRERLQCRGLIWQPQHGAPRLLCWAVYHLGDMDFGPPSADPQDASAAIAKTFNRIWYPNSNGEIVSRLPTIDFDDDFVFDIDGIHHEALYLLDGQLRSVKLPVSRRSS